MCSDLAQAVWTSWVMAADGAINYDMSTQGAVKCFPVGGAHTAIAAGGSAPQYRLHQRFLRCSVHQTNPQANSRRIDDEDLSELMSKEPQQRDWHPTVFWLVAIALVIALVAAVVGFAIAAEGIWDRLG